MASVTTPITSQPASTFTDITSGTPTPFESSIIPAANLYPPSSAATTPTYLVAIIAIIGFLIVAGGVICWLKMSASRAKEELYNQRQEMDPEVGPNMLVPIGEWKAVGSRGHALSIKDANAGMPPPRYSERVG